MKAEEIRENNRWWKILEQWDWVVGLRKVREWRVGKGDLGLGEAVNLGLKRNTSLFTHTHVYRVHWAPLICRVWGKAISIIYWTFCCTMHWMESDGLLGTSFLQSKHFYFFLGAKCTECVDIIRACTIFLLCVDRAVDPSLHGISWFCEGCCLHLKIVPKSVSALFSLCTPVPDLLFADM